MPISISGVKRVDRYTNVVRDEAWYVAHTGPNVAGFSSRTAYSGPSTITTNGTLVEGKNFTTQVDIDADNVTIRGCEFQNSLLRVLDPSAGTVIEDCLFRGASSSSGSSFFLHCLANTDIIVRRSEFKWCRSDPIKLSVGAYKLHDNYVHDNSPSEEGDHVDLIETWDGPCDGMEVVGNWIVYPGTVENTTTCLMLQPSSTGRYQNVLVENNVMGGCGYVMYPPGRGSSNPTPASNCRVINNRFLTTDYYPNSGFYAVSYSSGSVIMDWEANGNVWSGNVWHNGPNAGLEVTPND